MEKAARIIVRNRRGDHGRGFAETATMCLVAGRKGRGRTIHTVAYLPWSPHSIERAYRVLEAAALGEGYRVLRDDEL